MKIKSLECQRCKQRTKIVSFKNVGFGKWLYCCSACEKEIDAIDRIKHKEILQRIFTDE